MDGPFPSLGASAGRDTSCEAEDHPHVEPPPIVGDLLRQAFHDDYSDTLQFELIRLLLILSHVPSDEDRF